MLVAYQIRPRPGDGHMLDRRTLSGLCCSASSTSWAAGRAMTGPVRIGAEIEGEEAALAVAAALDELAPAVSAFETRESASGEPAHGEPAPGKPGLWRV